MKRSEATSFGGIVLCGGRSTRMGAPKLWLPFGPETMLQRVVRILREVVSPVAVVAAAAQELPPLSDDVLIVRDEEEALGPLAGLAAGLAGLAALRPHVEAAYASSCDVPLLKPEFVRRMLASLGSHEIAIPREGEFHHPLAAVYRTALADRVRALVAERRLRPVFLLEESDARAVPVESLREVDAELDSLRNTNHPDEYRAALAVAGLPLPTGS